MSPASGALPPLAVEDGTYKDGNVSFKVTRELQGNKLVIKYNGKVEGDIIRGKAEINASRGGTTREQRGSRPIWRPLLRDLRRASFRFAHSRQRGFPSSIDVSATGNNMTSTVLNRRWPI